MVGCLRLLRITLPLYAVVTLVALAPGIVGGIGIGLSPLQVEAMTLVLVILLGTQIAWVVTFANTAD